VEQVTDKMLATIDISKADAFKQKDKEMILSAVSKTVGLTQLNGVVLSLMRDWVIQVYAVEYKRRVGILGASHPDTLRSTNNMANLYYSQGKYDKAKPLFVECLSLRKAILGPSHPDTLQSMNNLAMLFYSQGKYDEAEPLYVECLALLKATLGTSHPYSLGSMNNLAMLYESQGKYDEAEKIRANI